MLFALDVVFAQSQGNDDVSNVSEGKQLVNNGDNQPCVRQTHTSSGDNNQSLKKERIMQDNQGSSHGQHTSIRMENVVSDKAQFETLERIRGLNGHNSPRRVSYSVTLLS